MNRQKFLSSPLMRIVVFAWVFVFPIIFIAIPLAEFFTGESEETSVPLWALVVWFLAPAVVSVVAKYFGGNEESKDDV